MVKLQKLVLRNFKSFKKADIPISRGFTAIVGSNGSGKTNILDALLFVLGISSMKMLRVSRIEELVNNNSVENYSKVELSLREGDKTYLIQRMIDKQGKSVYRLDGKRKTRNEVCSLLLELGIKPEGHNIVVQGDTTRVIEMSPIERRQIIDELAGLQEFDAKKEEALKELQKVDNKLRDAGIVMQEREAYLEQMRQDKEAATEFDSLQQESRKIKATRLFSEIESLENAEQECSQGLLGIEQEKRLLEEEIGQAVEEKALLKEKLEGLNSQILSQREKIYSTVGAKLEEAKTEKALALERIQAKEQLIQRNSERTVSLKEKAERTAKEIEGQKAEAEQIEAGLPELQQKIKAAAEKKLALESEANQREARLREMNEAIERLSTGLASKNKEMFEKSSLLNGLQKERELRKQTMREAMQASEALQAKLSEKQKKAGLLAQLRGRYGNIGQSLKKIQGEAENVLSELKEAEAEKKSLAQDLEALRRSLAVCPVCETRLAKEKRQSLATKKEARLKQVMQREQSLGQKKKDLDAKLAELKNALEKETGFAAQTVDLPELKASFLENGEKLSSIKQWLSLNVIEKLKSEEQSLRQKAKEKGIALSRQREKMKAFQEGSGIASLQQAANTLSKLEKEEHSLQQQRENLLESSSKQLQSHREEAIAEAASLSKESKKIGQGIEIEEKQLQATESKISTLEAKLLEAEKEGQEMLSKKEELDKNTAMLEEKARENQAKLKGIGQRENSLLIERSKREVRLADLGEEAQQFQKEERLKQFDSKALNQRLKEIQEKVEQLGAINMKALESFNQLEAEVLDVRKKLEQLDRERLAVVEMIEKIDVQRTKVFMQCFSELGKNFSKMFNCLFQGEGVLELSSQESPLEAGLLIQARHKGDSIRNIDSMSGGEKTMTALAFLFAIQLYEPASFYVFDEADAALDQENSAKMAKIIKDISRQSQFIAITHNDPLVQTADQIIGVALNKQKSSVIGLKLKEQIALEQAQQ